MISKILNFIIQIIIKIKSDGKLYLGENIKIYTPSVFIKTNSTLELKNNVRIYIGNHIELTPGNKMKFGSYTTLNKNNQLYGDIDIGNYCILASEIYMSSYSHSYKKAPYLPIRIAGKLHGTVSKKIIIEDDVWIGKGVIIMPGVYIAKGCIIGANTVVNKSIHTPYSIYYGINRPLGSRLKYSTDNEISIKEKFIPNFYKGICLNFSNNSLKSISGQDLIFLIKKPYNSSTISIIIENTTKDLVSLSIFPMDVSIYLNDKNISSHNEEMHFNENLKSVSEANNSYLLRFIFKKQMIIENLKIKWK